MTHNQGEVALTNTDGYQMGGITHMQACFTRSVPELLKRTSPVITAAVWLKPLHGKLKHIY